MHYKIVLFIFSSLFLLPNASVADETHSFAIRASLNKSSKGAYLVHFTVENISSKEFTVYRSQLPWDVYHSSVNFILRTGNGTLKECDCASFGFPIAGDVFVRPKEVIEGDIELEKLFPNI